MAVDRLQLETTEEGDDVVVTLTGELDASTVAVFEEAVGRHVDAEGPVVLDLAGLDFVDSSGLGAIVECHRARNEAGRTLELRAVPQRVETVLEYAGLAGHLTIRPDAAA